MYGAIEAGGTKFVVAVSEDTFKTEKKITIPTTTPEKTFAEVYKFFDDYNLKAIGIGSFGPIDTNKNSKTYGFITTTPKSLWKNTDFLGAFRKRYQIPIGWSTDVNAAALGEYKFGVAQGMNSCVYLTVGTGIGGGGVVNGQLLEGLSHPEMGHFYPPRHPSDHFKGVCRYHQNCLEGLASGPAIEKRYGISGKDLDADHEAWNVEAFYLAHAAMTITTVLNPSSIIFGGGVMSQKNLIHKVRVEFEKILKDYLDLPPLDEYILSPGLDTESGIIGSLLLAEAAFNDSELT